MSLSTLETAIVDELREVTGLSVKKLRKKDLMEWATAEITPQEGEKTVYLPKLEMWATYSEKK